MFHLWYPLLNTSVVYNTLSEMLTRPFITQISLAGLMLPEEFGRCMKERISLRNHSERNRRCSQVDEAV